MNIASDFLNLLSREVCDDPVQWLEDNIYLDNVVSPNSPGPLSLRHQPWARQIMMDVMDPSINHITLCTGAQTGKSLLMQLAYLLLCKFNPQPTIIAFPDDSLAERFVKTRLKPIIQCNPEFARKLPPPQVIGQKNMMFMEGMTTFYTGCRSPQKLCSMPAAYIILDEAAKLVKTKSSEAHPYKLLMERNKSFALHKVIEASTPATDKDPFWQSLTNSNWCKYMVPCPWCGELMEFKFDKEHLKWEGNTQEEIEKTCRIICTSCCCELDDNMRREAMNHGEWVAQNENHEVGHTGYHINSLYSSWKTIGEVAWEFVKSNHSVLKAEALHNFRNSWLAEPWEDYKTSVTNDDVRSLINLDHYREQLPSDMEYLVMGCDPGQHKSHYVVAAVCQGGRVVIVDWGMLASVSSKNGRNGIAWYLDNKTYRDSRGKDYKIDIAYVDSGYMTTTVYDEARMTIPGLINPTKGTGASGTYGRSMSKSNDIEVYTYSDFSLKVELYQNMFANHEVVLPRDTDDELIRGLAGQTLIVDQNGRRKWKELPEDHYGDCLKLCVMSMWVACENEEMRQRLRPQLNMKD